MEAELNYLLSFCVLTYPRWFAPCIIWGGGWKHESGLGDNDGMVIYWLLALGRERRTLRNVPVGDKCLDVP